MIRARIISLGILVAASGCTIRDVTIGEDIHTRPVADLEPGVSTAADILRQIGAPGAVSRLRYGSLFIYRLTETAASNLDVSLIILRFGYADEDLRPSVLVLQLDRKGILDSVALH